MEVDRVTRTVNPAGSPRLTPATPRANHDKMPFENFEALTTKLLKVPKEEVDEKRAEREKKRQQEETL